MFPSRALQISCIEGVGQMKFSYSWDEHFTRTSDLPEAGAELNV